MLLLCLPPSCSYVVWFISNAECADDGKLLSSKLAWFAYQQNGLVTLISLCSHVMASHIKEEPNWHIQIIFDHIIWGCASCVVCVSQVSADHLFIWSPSAVLFIGLEIIRFSITWWGTSFCVFSASYMMSAQNKNNCLPLFGKFLKISN